MRTRAQSPGTNQVSWMVKSGIWFALLAILAGAIMMMSTQAMSDPGAPVLASSISDTAPTGDVVASGDSYSITSAAPNIPDGKQLDTLYGTRAGEKDPVELLPAWRWQSTSGFYVNVGLRNVTANLISVFGSFLFLLSSFIWGLLLGVLKFGLTLDLVDNAALAINTGFVGLTDTIWSSGIVFLLAMVAVLIVAKMAITGKATKAIALVIMLVIPLGLMQGLATVAAGASEGGSLAESPKGSPSWFAQQGVGVLDTVGAGLGSGFGLLSGVSLKSSGSEQAENVTSCYNYYQALYHQYDAYVADPATPTGAYAKDQISQIRDAEGRINGDAMLKNQLNFRSDKSVATVSYLWERAYLQGWTNAQFGNAESAANIACHKLEDSADIDPYEQHRIAELAGYPVNPVSEDGWKVFEAKTGKDHESGMFAWAACRWDGSKMVATTEWDKGANLGDQCENWWKTGDVDGRMEWRDEAAIVGDTNPAKAGDDAELRAGLADVRGTALTFRGYNANIRLIGGFLSVATAAIYLYCLGGIAVGAVIAQLGLVLLLILLPATLLLLAMPTKEGRNPAGKKLLRLTGAFMAAKLILTVVMVFLLQTIMTFEYLLAEVAIGQSGVGTTFGGLLHALIPLAALVLIRMLLKQVGLGDITKLSGSVGMQASAAMAASGDGKGRGGWSKSGAGSLGNAINRSDKMSKLDRASSMGRLAKGATNAKGAKTALGAAAGGLAKGAIAADKATGGRGDVANRLAGITGRRDAAGNMLEMGMADRMRNRAALLGLGGAGAGLAAAGLSDKSQVRGAIQRRRDQLEGAREASENARAMRRAEIQTASGKTREEKQGIRKGLQGQNLLMTQFQDQKTSEFDTLGKDAAGNYVIEPRNNKGVLTGEAFALNRVTEPDALIRDALVAADTYDVKEEQLTVSGYGVSAVVTPQVKGSSTHASIPAAKSEQGTVEIAKDILHYLPDHQKERPKDLSSDDYGVYLHLMRAAAGGFNPETGRTVNVAEANGIRLDLESGKEELRKAMRGEDSAFDNIHYEVSTDQHQAILSYVRDIRKGEGGASPMFNDLAAVRSQAAAAIVVQVNDDHSQANELVEKVASLKLEVGKNADRFSSARESSTKRASAAEAISPEFVAKIQEALSNERSAASASTPDQAANYQAAAQSLRDQAEAIRGQFEGDKGSTSALMAFETSQRDFEDAQVGLAAAMREMMDSSGAATGASIESRKSAFEADLSFDLFLANKNKVDTGVIVDKAADFDDKIFPGMKSAMEAAVLQAQGQLMNAVEEGNRDSIRIATEALNAAVRRNFGEANKATQEAMRKHSASVSDLTQQAAHDLENRKHTIQPGLPKASALFGR